MNRRDGRPASGRPHDLTRRNILRVSSLAAIGAGLTVASPNTIDASNFPPMSCVFLLLLGGPSQLDTWDMKPDAPAEIRGPFRPIETNVPGLRIGEMFPRMARVMDKVALVRSVHHRAVPVHDTGLQLIQTGRVAVDGAGHPHYASVLAYLHGPTGDQPPHVILPGPLGPTGGNMDQGQGTGFLDSSHGPPPIELEPDGRLLRGHRSAPRDAFRIGDESPSLRDRYGRTEFGRNCLMARRLVERGVRFVTVNMGRTVFRQTTWDCHGSAPFTRLDAYGTTIGPTFDHAYSTLLEDLDHRGMLETTMVLALGEFGRTPRINPSGGRDHHPGCSTALFAGGPFRRGQAVGASDAIGSAPIDRPVSPAEIAATIYHGFGLNLDAELPGPDGCPIRLVDNGIQPIAELT